MKQQVSAHEYYMQRCIDLAKKGLGHTYPNPMVGSVIVHNGKIIGEGWHKKAGEPHAEVNAIAAVKNKALLATSTLYVSLEPCNHFGKTPPCSQLIVKHNIPKVVIGCVDPFDLVSGAGIETLRNAGIEVITGILEKETTALNKRFFCFHQKKRPYIVLKWAQSQDGFLAPLKEERKKLAPVFLTTKEEQIVVHQWRTEEQAIAVGAQTVVDDNPQLTARWVKGNQPTRLVFDPNSRLERQYAVFDDQAETIQLSHALVGTDKTANPSEYLEQVFKYLHTRNIQSVLIEGGGKTLENIVAAGLWDEARIFKTEKTLAKGIPAPKLTEALQKEKGLSIIQRQKLP